MGPEEASMTTLILGIFAVIIVGAASAFAYVVYLTDEREPNSSVVAFIKYSRSMAIRNDGVAIPRGLRTISPHKPQSAACLS
jgi:hypothetical protein